jgi:hypothetical protein
MENFRLSSLANLAPVQSDASFNGTDWQRIYESPMLENIRSRCRLARLISLEPPAPAVPATAEKDKHH